MRGREEPYKKAIIPTEEYENHRNMIQSHQAIGKGGKKSKKRSIPWNES